LIETDRDRRVSPSCVAFVRHAAGVRFEAFVILIHNDETRNPLPGSQPQIFTDPKISKIEATQNHENEWRNG
jgi:hypothetical protein